MPLALPRPSRNSRFVRQPPSAKRGNGLRCRESRSQKGGGSRRHPRHEPARCQARPLKSTLARCCSRLRKLTAGPSRVTDGNSGDSRRVWRPGDRRRRANQDRLAERRAASRVGRRGGASRSCGGGHGGLARLVGSVSLSALSLGDVPLGLTETGGDGRVRRSPRRRRARRSRASRTDSGRGGRPTSGRPRPGAGVHRGGEPVGMRRARARGMLLWISMPPGPGRLCSTTLAPDEPRPRRHPLSPLAPERMTPWTA